MTRRLSLKRESAWVSGTTNNASPCMARAQKDTSRGVSDTSSPIRALNHWRCASTRLIADMGVPQTVAAARVRLSNAASGAESSTS